MLTGPVVPEGDRVRPPAEAALVFGVVRLGEQELEQPLALRLPLAEGLGDQQSVGKVVDGLTAIGQAAIAFEKFFGKAPPRAHDAELMEILTR